MRGDCGEPETFQPRAEAISVLEDGRSQSKACQNVFGYSEAAEASLGGQGNRWPMDVGRSSRLVRKIEQVETWDPDLCVGQGRSDSEGKRQTRSEL